MMKRPSELHDLSASKQRVIANVEQQLTKQSKKSKAALYSAVVLVACLIVAFTATMLSKNETPSPTTTTPDSSYDELLKSYIPPDQTYKVMTSFEGTQRTILTEWLSEHYYQETITANDGSEYIVYYRVANNQIDKLTETPSNQPLTLEQLTELPNAEAVLKAPFEQLYTDENDSLLVEKMLSYGGYEHVLRVTYTTPSNQTVSLYAESIGLIEQTVYENEQVIATEQLLTISATKTDEPIAMSFRKTINTSLTATFHTPWLYSPSGTQRITLEGRGEFGSEEGEGVLILEQLDTNEKIAFSLQNTGQPLGQRTPKKLAWIDEERLFVTVGMAHGTVTQGGELYILHLQDGRLTPVFTNLREREEISDIVRLSETTFEYVRFVYETADLDFNASYTESGTIELLNATVHAINHKVVNITELQANTAREISIDLQPYSLPLDDIEAGNLYELLIVGDFVHSIQ